MKSVCILIVSLCSLATGTLASAQPLDVALSGEVYDVSGRTIQNAAVVIRGGSGQELTRTTTTADGTWRVRVSRAEAHEIEISAFGFRTLRRPVDNAMRNGVTMTATLAIEARNEQVVVTAVAERAPLEVVMDPRQPRQPIPAHDGADYLATIAGFSTVRKGGSAADPVLRGMAGSRLAILADGAALLGGCSNRMDPPTAYIFPETYDVVTVIKGPQTVKHGAAASAGTVLFERVNERLSEPMFQANGSTTFGAWGRNDQVFDLRAGNRLFYVRGLGSRSAMGDYHDGDGNAVHSQYMRWNADTSIGWTPSDKARLEVTHHLSDGHAAYADRGVDGSKFRRNGVNADVELRQLGPMLNRVEVSAYYNYMDHVMDNYTLRTTDPAMTTPMAMNPDRTTFGGRAMTTWTLSRALIETGADLQRNQHRSRNTMRQDLAPYENLPRIDDARFLTTGVFGELNYLVSSQTRIIGGVRADIWTATDERQQVALSMMAQMPNPTAGLRRVDVLGSGFARLERKATGSPVTLYAGLGRATRFPDFWELATSESKMSVSAFETRPETTTQLDAGVRFDRASTSGYLSVFVNRIDDFILIQSNYPKSGMMGTTRSAVVTRNVDARSGGAELGVTQRWGTAWSVDGSVAYARGANLTDDLPLAQMPPLETRVTVQYDGSRWSLGGLTRLAAAQRRVAAGQGTIVGRDFAPTDGFAVVSVNGGWKVTRWAQLTAGVDNVLNAVYAEHINRQSVAIPGYALQTAQVREPGRTAWVRLSVRP